MWPPKNFKNKGTRLKVSSGSTIRKDEGGDNTLDVVVNDVVSNGWDKAASTWYKHSDFLNLDFIFLAGMELCASLEGLSMRSGGSYPVLLNPVGWSGFFVLS